MFFLFSFLLFFIAPNGVDGKKGTAPLHAPFYAFTLERGLYLKTLRQKNIHRTYREPIPLAPYQRLVSALSEKKLVKIGSNPTEILLPPWVCEQVNKSPHWALEKPIESMITHYLEWEVELVMGRGEKIGGERERIPLFVQEIRNYCVLPLRGDEAKIRASLKRDGMPHKSLPALKKGFLFLRKRDFFVDEMGPFLANIHQRLCNQRVCDGIEIALVNITGKCPQKVAILSEQTRHLLLDLPLFSQWASRLLLAQHRHPFAIEIKVLAEKEEFFLTKKGIFFLWGSTFGGIFFFLRLFYRKKKRKKRGYLYPLKRVVVDSSKKRGYTLMERFEHMHRVSKGAY